MPSQDDEIEMVRLILARVPELVPDAEHVTLAVRDGRRLTTLAWSSAAAAELDEVQSRLAEGPSLDVLAGRDLVRSGDARDEARWPRWGPQGSGDADEADLLASCLSELVSVTAPAPSRAAALGHIARTCQRAFVMPTFVSITLGPPSEPALLATDSTIAQEIDGLQIAAGEGPCQSAWSDGQPTVSAHVQADDRWPRLRRLLPPEPLVSVVALPLATGGEPLGALNVYGHDPALALALAEDQWLRHGELLATTVTALVHEVEARTELEDLSEQLRTALASRAPIEQAKGVLMATRGCTAEEAFALLRETSNQQNVKVRDLATRVLQRAAGAADDPLL